MAGINTSPLTLKDFWRAYSVRRPFRTGYNPSKHVVFYVLNRTTGHVVEMMEEAIEAKDYLTHKTDPCVKRNLHKPDASKIVAAEDMFLENKHVKLPKHIEDVSDEVLEIISQNNEVMALPNIYTVTSPTVARILARTDTREQFLDDQWRRRPIQYSYNQVFPLLNVEVVKEGGHELDLREVLRVTLELDDVDAYLKQLYRLHANTKFPRDVLAMLNHYSTVAVNEALQFGLGLDWHIDSFMGNWDGGKDGRSLFKDFVQKFGHEQGASLYNALTEKAGKKIIGGGFRVLNGGYDLEECFKEDGPLVQMKSEKDKLLVLACFQTQTFVQWESAEISSDLEKGGVVLLDKHVPRLHEAVLSMVRKARKTYSAFQRLTLLTSDMVTIDVHEGSLGNDYFILDSRDRLGLLEKNTNVMGKHELISLDHTPCRLPKLDQSRMTDPDQGLWELYGEAEDFLREHDLVARNPSLDIQHRSVAIDFGTSSTVVAVDTPNGGRELLRVGVRDFYQPVAAHHFENPTVVECLDFQSFSKIWQQEAYRPSLNWDWMRASHEAQTSLRDNPGNPQILASILSNLKHWALYSHEERRTRLSDRKDVELEIPPHTELNPVRGEALQVSENDPFDPIELYAWYLGMAINWRGRGLFLKYYLSFPVKYDRQIKDRILASFRRGLQRSLPRTLIDTSPSVLNDIEINDLATEPTAYAAAALARLDVEPTDDGVRYGVFDFGGGTTDFDYGLMRWSTDEEDAQGYEVVFESLGSSGDEFLGGENLLNHLVYETFSAAENLEELRSHRIQFTRPLDAKPFPGSEPFIAATQAAQTNTIMLAARLRSFMEDESPSLEPEVTLDLVDTNNEKQQCTLSIDEERLDTLLAKRIGDGFFAFLAQLAEVHGEAPHEEAIHCLLAGNGSRSRYLTRLMEDKEIWQNLIKGAFGNTEVNLVVHKPLEMSEQDPHAPTGKTGVALGLLRIKPGENTLLINHVLNKHDDQAPFSWFVGRLRRNQFKPMIQPNAPYGEWVELGPLQQGIFNLYSSRSPRAKQMRAGDAELRKQRLDFPAASKGAKLFARPTAPNEIAVAAADTISNIDVNEQQLYPLT